MHDQHRGTTEDPCVNAELNTAATEPTWEGKEQHHEVRTRPVVYLTDVLGVVERGTHTMIENRIQRRILRTLTVLTVGVALEIPAAWICAANQWITEDLASSTIASTAPPLGACWLAVAILAFGRRKTTT